MALINTWLLFLEVNFIQNIKVEGPNKTQTKIVYGVRSTLYWFNVNVLEMEWIKHKCRKIVSFDVLFFIMIAIYSDHVLFERHRNCVFVYVAFKTF